MTQAARLEWLREIVAGLKTINPPTGAITQDWLDRLPLVRGKIVPALGFIGISKEVADALYNLVEAILAGSSQYSRGARFEDLSTAVSDAIIIGLFGRKPESITEADLATIEDTIADWFQPLATRRRLYIPCRITEYHAPPFAIGPVSFQHLDDFSKLEPEVMEEFNEFGFRSVLSLMNNSYAHWLAVVDVDGCEQNRAWELGELAVDIALVGLQLIIPLSSSEQMARLTARTRPAGRTIISRVAGVITPTIINDHPGIGLANGVLEKNIADGAVVLQSVGRRVQAYLTGLASFPNLEQAWCDAAYWLHEGLAEPIDTIAVAKLETSIEVLLGAQSTSGSKHRLLMAIKTFYGLSPSEYINPNSLLTVKAFVEGFVRDRSRILHGTWSTLNSRLRDSRASLAYLVRVLIANYAFELDGYFANSTAKDEIAAFLSWVEIHRRDAAEVAAATVPSI